ncbi:phosphorylcholine phosphatase [Streptomyces sp. Ru71]|uniref:haloacid dehalogenase-like hydrolase n=1 Tax=Streptomyces sp. Ru71 TaxID=2080746 RepID=UPI000CDD1422|nr:phosphorylcholine phosphatase [Streptomyces sp. Ru71]
MPVSRRQLLSAVPVVAAATAVPIPARASEGPAPGREVRLRDWPEAQGRRLARLIEEHAGRGAYAVFDADNTIWRYDLEEALLPYLETKGVLTREAIDPSLKLIPFRDGESLYSYYVRLCEIDDKIGYPWIAQVFSGFSLRELKTYVDELFAHGSPIPVTYYDGDTLVHDTVNPPRIYPGQRELLNALRRHGITPYVMTAAHEELVRMVVSDPRYGLGVEPRNVIGVTTALRDPATGELTTARKQIEQGHFLDAAYPADKHAAMIVTPYLWTPATWYVGKLAGIKEYIDPYRRPVLVAGDSPSDWFMLFDTDVRAGGLRLWVNRKQKYTDALESEKAERADGQKAAGVPVDADRGWVVVKPAEIGG